MQNYDANASVAASITDMYSPSGMSFSYIPGGTSPNLDHVPETDIRFKYNRNIGVVKVNTNSKTSVNSPRMHASPSHKVL